MLTHQGIVSVFESSGLVEHLRRSLRLEDIVRVTVGSAVGPTFIRPNGCPFCPLVVSMSVVSLVYGLRVVFYYGYAFVSLRHAQTSLLRGLLQWKQRDHFE